MLQRAYSVIEITKDFDQGQRSFAGIATSPQPDRMQDVIDSAGVTYAPSLPLLLYHDKIKPVGEARFGRFSAKGTPFNAVISKIDRPGIVKDRLQEAEDSLLANPPLIRGVSIGFRPLVEPIYIKETGGYRYPKIEVLELSMVVVPAHQGATIDVIKSLDKASLAASGTGPSASRSTPGVSGRQQDKTMNVSEQIAEQRALLQTKSARLEELMNDDDREGGLSDDESKERDQISVEVKTLTSKITHLGALEAAQMAQATNVTMPSIAPTRPTQTRTEFKTVELPKGTLFARYAMAVAAGKGSHSDTIAYAKRWDGQTPEVSRYIKAVAGTTDPDSPSWGSELLAQRVTGEFVELLMPATIIGRLGLNASPFNTRLVVQTGGGLVDWVVQTGVKPVGEMTFDELTLDSHKIAGIIVLSEELVRFSRPNAEDTVRRQMVKDITKFMDEQFIDPAVGAGAGNPASVTNNVTPTAASGTDADALYTDINTALAGFDSTDMGSDGVRIVTTPAIARGISVMRTALGNRVEDGVTPNGGTLLGFPVIVSNSVPAGYLIFIKSDEVLLADDGQVRLDASNQATLDMSGGSSPAFSLWQRNCVGIRAERFITWKKRRAEAVSMISGAAYGPAVGSP